MCSKLFRRVLIGFPSWISSLKKTLFWSASSESCPLVGLVEIGTHVFFSWELFSQGDIWSRHVAQSDGHSFEILFGVSTEDVLFVRIEVIKFHAGGGRGGEWERVWAGVAQDETASRLHIVIALPLELWRIIILIHEMFIISMIFALRKQVHHQNSSSPPNRAQ